MADESNEKTVVLYKNGIQANGVVITLPGTMAELLKQAEGHLELERPAQRIFLMTGQEVKDIPDISEGDFLFVSCGEDFTKLAPSAAMRASSSNLPEEGSSDADFDEMNFDGKALGFDVLPSEYQNHLLGQLEEGEKVLWTDTPQTLWAVLRFLVIAITVVLMGGLLSWLIHTWQASVVVMSMCGIFVVIVAAFMANVFHEFYAITSRRIIILHAGCLFGLGPCKRDVKRSPPFTELTNFQIEVEEQFGVGSVMFRSTNVGFKYVDNAQNVADMVKKRIPEAPPRTLLKF
eukprot:CAMPEP_0177647332 /NCGR_PEP_ID=MMETSP0447-20121125/10242_1 /TAXON_ID=0 /ORGANISM="Stygamoeba regulata, Strain BSH-02190019" /LENGTH=289 /DNA_ID=CAMNT_0019149907 /DNA_START=150 /DNA_END=1019 /DNA_ORIENTATION=-